jgi:hypothetical protein
MLELVDDAGCLLHRLRERRREPFAERVLEPACRRPDLVQVGWARQPRRSAQRVCERQRGRFGLVDSLRIVRLPERGKLRPELLELAAAGRLLGQLADRRDRDRRAHERPVRNRPRLVVKRQPGPLSRLEGAKVDPLSRGRLGRDHAHELLSRASVVERGGGDPLEVGLEFHRGESLAYDGGRMFRKRPTEDEQLAKAKARLKEAVEQELLESETELQHTLSVARAETSAQLAQEQRRLADERRDELVRAEQRVLTELTGRLISAQKQIETKLTAWTQDLERVREGLATQLARLEQRQRQLIADAESRFTAESERLMSDTEDHRNALVRLRQDIERQIKETVEESANELETHAAERRRALHEIADRLRNRERSLAEQIEREQMESARKVTEAFADVERRLVDQVERSVAREAARLTEAAAVEFNSTIRAAREEAARRLSRELDRAIDSFSRQAERLLAEKLAELGDSGGNQIERRIQKVTDFLEERQEEFLAALEQRMARIESAVRDRMDSLASAAGRSSRE